MALVIMYVGYQALHSRYSVNVFTDVDCPQFFSLGILVSSIHVVIWPIKTYICTSFL